MRLKSNKMRCVNLEKEIDDQDCVTGISVIDKMFGDFPAQYQFKFHPIFQFSASFADHTSQLIVKNASFVTREVTDIFFTNSQPPFNHPDPRNISKRKKKPLSGKLSGDNFLSKKIFARVTAICTRWMKTK